MSEPRVHLLDGWVDLARRQVHRAGGEESLTGREAALLAAMWASSGVDVPRGTLLQEVWGLLPDTNTRTLDATVRRLRRKIEPDPTTPQLLLTAHGVGYRWAPPLAASAPDAPSRVQAPFATIPVDDGPFVGRDRELLALLDTLSTGARVALVGPGGVGKSHLARVLAHRWSAARARPAWWVDLTGITDPAGVVQQLARALSIRPDPADPAGSVHRSLTRLGEGLIVLDGVDLLPEALLAWMDWPELTLLATQRGRRGPWRAERVRPLATADATTLFQLLAARKLQPADEAPTASLVPRLDGLPLAVALAARRLRVLSVPQLLQRLSRGPDVLVDPLAAPDDDLPGRIHRWWATLSPAEQADLALLSILREPFDLDLAEALLGPDALDRLDPLVDASWLERHDGHFAWLDALHAEACAHLDLPRATAAWPPLIEHLAARAHAHVHPLFGPRTIDAVRWLTARRSLLRRAVDHADPEHLVPLLTALAFLDGEPVPWDRVDHPVAHYHQGRPDRSAPEQAAAHALREAMAQGLDGRVVPSVAHALDVLTAQGDVQGITVACRILAYAHAGSGDWAQAAAARRRGLDATDDPYLTAHLRIVPFPLPADEQPDLDDYAAVIALAAAVGDVALEVRALVGGAFTALERQDVDQSLAWASRCRDRLWAVDRSGTRVGALGNLGIVFREVAHFASALRCFEQAGRELIDAVSSGHAFLLAIGHATTLLDQGRDAQARQVLDRAARIDDDPRRTDRVAMFVALADALQGASEATDTLVALHARFREASCTSEQGRCALWLAARTGRAPWLSEAEACFGPTGESELLAVDELARLQGGGGTLDADAPHPSTFSSQVRFVRRLAGHPAIATRG